MKITFEQTADDIFDLSKISLRNNRVFKKLGIIIGSLVIINAFFIFSKENFRIESVLSWTIPMVMIVVI